MVERQRVPVASRPTSTYRNLLAAWATSNVAHFGVMAVTSLYLLTVLRLPAVLAATALFVVMLLARLSRLLAMPVMGWLGDRAGLRLGLGLGLAGNVGLALVSWWPAVALLLAVVGMGYSTTALAIKAVVARLPVGSRLMRYASINLYLNVGAAVGPLLTNALFLHWQPRGPFLLGGLAYGLAMLLSARVPTLAIDDGGSAGLLRDIRSALVRLSLWRTLALNTLGFFLYSQLYSALPLYVRFVLQMPDLLGVLLAVNGLFAVLVQIPLIRLAGTRRVGPMSLVLLSFAGYALGFAALWLVQDWVLCLAVVLLWTVCETLLFPSVDAMFADAEQAGSGLVAFTLAGMSAALGESLGSFTGVALAGQLDASGSLSELYGVFTLAALASLALAAGLSPRPGRGSAS